MANWRAIDGYGEKYLVSDTGGVKTSAGKIVKPSLNRGYPQVVLYLNSNPKCVRVHQLVAIAFIPNPKNKSTVNHINGIKSDNRVENLEWLTQIENKQHALLNGLVAKREKHGMAKLLESSILIIRAKLAAGETCQKIANQFKVSKSTISRIGRSVIWK